MNRITRLLPLLLLAASAVAQADAGGNDQYRPGIPAAKTGAEVYRMICQGCHMPDGKGAKGAGSYPALAGDKALASPEFVAITVLAGRRNMPNFGGTFPFGDGFFVLPQLTDEQIAGVVNHVRTSFGNRFKGTISAAQVKVLRDSLQKK
jgi:mono/diheme cytochrome c family protein